MNGRHRLVAVSISTLVLVGGLAGCGSYDDTSNKATGGASGTAPTGGGSGTATGGTGGTATGGTSGSATGGAGGSGGSGAPTGGAAGSAGSGGAPQGGSGGQPSCDVVAACGGDVVGTWAASSCPITVSGMADISLAGLGCTMAPVTGSLTVTGTWTAVAGGTYMDATTTTGQVVHELAPICLEVSGFTTECDRIVLDSVGLPSPEPPTQQCVVNTATQGCTCTTTINQQGGLGLVQIGAPMSGTYTTADNKVVATAAGVDTPYSYCVAGSTLTMTLDPASGAAPARGPIVLQKQ
jgi:hypothetical protein